MIKIKTLKLVCSKEELKSIPDGKVLINTINAFSYNNAKKDALFGEALTHGDYLIPDGASIVKACRWLNAQCQPKERIAGWDLFCIEMAKLEAKGAEVSSEHNPTRPKVMFMGSSDKVLSLIRQRAATEYPNFDNIRLLTRWNSPTRTTAQWLTPLTRQIPTCCGLA